MNCHLTLAVAFLSCLAFYPTAKAAKPNILFLLSDDHSYPFLSAYGDTNVNTPTLDQLAADARGLLQHLGIARTHWLGLSMGGMVGQTLAIQSPELLDRVVLADTTGQMPPAAATLWAERVTAARSQGMPAT